MNVVLREDNGGVATVTLNRPEALNALSGELRNELSGVLEAIAVDESVEVVILTGAGRAFTAGLDLKELGGEKDGADALTELNVSNAMAAIKVPIIGAINGYAITGGFELALMCDILLATPNTRFADTHARVGVVPGWGLSQRLPRLIGIARAKELSLTGNYLDAERAYDWGLVNRIVDADDLLPTANRLAQDILSTDYGTRMEIKRIMDEGWHTDLAEGLAVERAANRAHSKASVSAEGIRARRQGIQDRGRRQSGSAD